MYNFRVLSYYGIGRGFHVRSWQGYITEMREKRFFLWRLIRLTMFTQAEEAYPQHQNWLLFRVIGWLWGKMSRGCAMSKTLETVTLNDVVNTKRGKTIVFFIWTRQMVQQWRWDTKQCICYFFIYLNGVHVGTVFCEKKNYCLY